MRTTATRLLLMMLSLSLLHADPLDDAQENDIKQIAALVPKEEQSYVETYLAKGDSGKVGSVPSLVAQNALNILERKQSITMPLARRMVSLLRDAKQGENTRAYAFAKLGRMARQNDEVKNLFQPVAEELARKEQGMLKRMADEYLAK